jgi:hypothetical protein
MRSESRHPWTIEGSHSCAKDAHEWGTAGFVQILKGLAGR